MSDNKTAAKDQAASGVVKNCGACRFFGRWPQSRTGFCRIRSVHQWPVREFDEWCGEWEGREPHPWYGPCDALGPEGTCAECAKTETITRRTLLTGGKE